MRILFAVLFLLGLVLGAGCQPDFGGTATARVTQPAVTVNPTQAPQATLQPVSPTQNAIPPERTQRSVPRLPERISPTDTVVPVTGEVPDDLLQAMRADLAKRSGAPAGQITLSQAQSMVWNDGSLGCPKPGVMYTQSLVNGYWVVFEAAGQEYDYRAAKSGHFFLCESGSAPVVPAGTPVQ